MLGRNLPPESQLTLFRAVYIIANAGIPLKERQRSLELALEEAVSRALRDRSSSAAADRGRTASGLRRLGRGLLVHPAQQRSSGDAARADGRFCASRGLVRAIELRCRCVEPARQPLFEDLPLSNASAVAVQEPADIPSVVDAAPAPIAEDAESEWVEAAEEVQDVPASAPDFPSAIASPPTETAEPSATSMPAFDVASLPPDLQDLHRRANRVAKVAMQDIKLLRPKDVRLGRE